MYCMRSVTHLFSLNTDFDWAEDAGYEILKKKIYKTNIHVFLTPKSKNKGVQEP